MHGASCEAMHGELEVTAIYEKEAAMTDMAVQVSTGRPVRGGITETEMAANMETDVAWTGADC